MSKGYKEYFLSISKTNLNTQYKQRFSTPKEDRLSLSDIFTELSHIEKVTFFKEILENKIHGLAFSPYLDNQEPTMEISLQQIQERMSIIAPYAQWIRTFSCTGGNQHSPSVAKHMGLNTLVGVDIGKDKKKNQEEIDNAIEIARQGNADILSIGNEVLLRGDISVTELEEYLIQVKTALPNQVVSYVDAYFLFEKYPEITELCDVLLINCYPFWESTPFESAVAHVSQMYYNTISIAKGKKVIISETGWPSQGTPFGAATPGEDSALNYFISIYKWAEQHNIEVFYFSSFDEKWKQGDEGDVGAHWGLWDANGVLKYHN